MRHIRNDHNIEISGSQAKRDLLEMGYYHGYKAYRFYKTPNNPFKLTSFKQVVAIYEFDNALKKAFYQPIMKFETTMKNVVLDHLVSGSKDTIYLSQVFEQHLDGYREIDKTNDAREYNRVMGQRLKLRSDFAREASMHYTKSQIVKHFVNNEEAMPIWAYFEIIMLGTFGEFVKLLNTATKLEITRKIGTHNASVDSGGKFLEQHIFAIKDLRNAVAHNAIVFEKSVKFSSILDYAAILVYYAKTTGASKIEIKEFITELERAIEKLVMEIDDIEVVFKTVGSDYPHKLRRLMDY
ncbi:MAG: Abi family protein [Lactobacillaceae bacterium]|jgi:abortive infection bacteriophage resistance protein|nr:Abi family protein [Lactobacillaceae bacterium]